MAASRLTSAASKKFSIDDAFEEDHNDAIRVYGATTERSPLKPKSRLFNGTEDITVKVEDPRENDKPMVNLNNPPKLKNGLSEDTASKDSDSLIQDSGISTMYDPSQSWWRHPKVRENWKMVLAAFILLLIGLGLVVTGIVVVSLPIHGVQSVVFFIAGAICFIPGAYHVIYIYLAVKGKRGYDFYHLPLFN